MRKIHSKLKALEWSQYFSHYKSMGIFPNAQGQVTHKSQVGSCWISNPSEILNNEEDPIKNEGARVVTTLLINFSDAKGQLTPKSVLESCPDSNLPKLLWSVLLSARMKKIHPKMKVVEWSQHFSHYKSMGIFLDAQGQVTHKSLVGSCRISNPFEILWLSLLPARIKMNK